MDTNLHEVLNAIDMQPKKSAGLSGIMSHTESDAMQSIETSSTPIYDIRGLERNISPKISLNTVEQLIGRGEHPLVRQLREANLIGQDNNWTGRSATVVVHGNILGGRYATSLSVIKLIKTLQEDGKNQGEIVVLAGHSDDVTFAWLSGEKIHVGGKPKQVPYTTSIPSSTTGLAEIKKHIDSLGENPDSNDGSEKHNLPILKMDSVGQDILAFMSHLQLVEIIGDVLYIHGKPHHDLIKLIDTHGVNSINSLYQKGIQHFLLGAPHMSDEEILAFHHLRYIFLDTSHKKELHDHALLEKFKNIGINTISTNQGRWKIIKEHNVCTLQSTEN